MRRLIFSGSPYEPRVGIARAVRVGSVIRAGGLLTIQVEALLSVQRAMPHGVDERIDFGLR